MKYLIYIAIVLLGLGCCQETNNQQWRSSNVTPKDTISANDSTLKLKIDSLRDSIKTLTDSVQYYAKLNVMKERKDSLTDSLVSANQILEDSLKVLSSEKDSLSDVIKEFTTPPHKSLWQTIKEQWIYLSIIFILLLCLILSLWKRICSFLKPQGPTSSDDKNKTSQDDEVSKLQEENKQLRENNVSLESEKKELINEKDRLITENEKLVSEKTRIEREKDKRIKNLIDSLDKANIKIGTIRSEVEERKNKEIESIKKCLNSEKEQHNKTKQRLSSTEQKLVQTSDTLRQTRSELARLEAAQRVFTASLTSVPFAQGYAKKVETLMQVVDSIIKKGLELLNQPLSDYYHVMKAFARYVQRMQSIKSSSFSIEVLMPSKAKFAFKDSQLAQFNQNSNENDLQIATKQYFFEKYLKTYIDAAVVLNESLAGLHYLIPDLDASNCSIFNTLRSDLLKVCNELEIQVNSVKIFEFIGEKIDLSVQMIDAGIGKSGQILEIKNCQVSLVGANTPPEKISVIVQD